MFHFPPPGQPNFLVKKKKIPDLKYEKKIFE